MRSHRSGLGFLARVATHRWPQCRWGGTVSESRLEEFMKAEVHYFAQQRDQQGLEPLTLPQLVSQSYSLECMEQALRRELPIRFAARIKHIQKIQQWEKIPELVDLHNMHVTSFRELRLAEVRGHTNLSEVVQRIRQRHKPIAGLFAEAVSAMHNILPDFSDVPASAPNSNTQASPPGEGGSMDFQALDAWADRFLQSRISTELMMTHYMEMIQAGEQKDCMGILDKDCDPYEVCLVAAQKTSKLGSTSCVINVKEPRKAIRVCHTPRYLYYILHELLSTSVRSTLGNSQARPIDITVCADDHDVVIRICDNGGGLAAGHAANKWSYTSHLSSADEPPVHSLRTLMEEESKDGGDEAAILLKPWASEHNPLSGRGIGLPMCRLYAQYLGGTLEVINMPGEGVDTYLIFHKIELARNVSNGMA